MVQTIPVSSEDDAFLFDLYADSRSTEMQTWGWDEAMIRSFLLMQWNAQKLSYAQQYPDSKQFLVVTEKMPVGRVIVSQTDKEIRLVDLIILSAYRNAGIGTSLLQQFQNEAFSTCLPVRLSVLKTNPAKELYIRLGFRLIGENDMYDFMESGEPSKG
ncbi:GNAT family N-acetyltransferase [Paenibacillus harenae]|uniref:Ribosomal protein S18 acetylase RimI-like enzyme n=1 Tax=Paenibacillus harenae TaxID=306543 RepID=A0ABT9U989_PAEHA|nr:GNAT family N-acetyltransferase [Paenibacillus harenae]MDQ0116209.1 ribosomal protein S18 acetylase RimI-like enzyme [Paenibacillus harenae]